MNTNNAAKKKRNYILLISIVSLILVFGLWLGNWIILNKYPNDVRGTHGDMFGAVNAIFSGLAFAGIIISLYMQRIDLKNQQEQLELNYEEVKQTNKEFKIQNDTLKVQQFENQYYKMIDLHRENVTDITIPYWEKSDGSSSSYDDIGAETTTYTINNQRRELKSRKVFVDMAKELEVCLEDSLKILAELDSNYNKDDIFNFAYKIFFWGLFSEFVASDVISQDHQKKVKNHIYKKQTTYKDNLKKKGNKIKQEIRTRYIPFQGHESRLAFYYRHLFHTVRYVVDSKESGLINYEQARQYLRIIRSQLSNSEQLMLYYNYICGFGVEWDKKGTRNNTYFTEYRMIHNLPIHRVKFVEPPREHFADYIKNYCNDKNELFEWGDSNK